MVRKMARDFARNVVKPKALEMDEKHALDPGIIKQMSELNFWGIPAPEEFGGAGMDQLSYIIAVEELSRADGGLGISIAAHTSLCVAPILKFGTDEQKKKYLPKLCAGEYLGGFGLTEPNAGTDAGATQTTGVKKGNEWVINGSKMFNTNAEHAGVWICSVMTEPEKKMKGITAFLIDRENPGFKVGKSENKMGLRSSSTCELIMEDCKVTDAAILGKPGEGFKIMMKILDGGRISIAALALGVAQGAFDEGVKYAQEREQFGKPIAAFQGIQWMLADSAVKVEAARHLVYEAARRYQKGEPHSLEAAMAKLYAAETAREVTNDMLQVHGGYGYMKEYHIERMYRDAKVLGIVEGTNEVHKMVIARDAIKNG
ncbi:MAG: acyl-CoA dehydrogenase family protein, partial [Planctomycetota bacterium]